MVSKTIWKLFPWLRPRPGVYNSQKKMNYLNVLDVGTLVGHMILVALSWAKPRNAINPSRGRGGFYSPFHAMFVWWGLNQLRWSKKHLSVCMILLSATLPQNNLNLAVCYPVPVSLQQLNLIVRKLTQTLLCATPSYTFLWPLNDQQI